MSDPNSESGPGGFAWLSPGSEVFGRVWPQLHAQASAMRWDAGTTLRRLLERLRRITRQEARRAGQVGAPWIEDALQEAVLRVEQKEIWARVHEARGNLERLVRGVIRMVIREMARRARRDGHEPLPPGSD